MSLNNLRFLLDKGVKAVFVACGSATSNALDLLEKESSVPVFGVVEPAAREAVSLTQSGKIGLLATRASVAAGTYQRLIRKLLPEAAVTAKACPKFATMVEDGIFEKDDGRVLDAASEYLPPLRLSGVDTVILGCTHYPVLADVISEYMGADVRLISAGAAAARRVRDFIEENNMLSRGKAAKTEYFTTGETGLFARTANIMLQRDISSELTGIAPFDKRRNV
jgi:glutamate racemase